MARPPRSWRSNWGTNGIIGASLLAVLFTAGALGPLAMPDPLRLNVPMRLQPPTTRHLMGTDEFGRDILSRVLNGSRISLASGVGVVLIGLCLGVPLGTLAAYHGGTTNVVIMGFVDLMLAVPGILLAIVIAALLSPRLSTAILAVGIFNIPYYARLVWGVTQAVRAREYVEAARASGATDARIILRHISPATIPAAMVQATLGVGTGILSVTALSFLGMGAQPPIPEWGLMMSEAQRYILTAPYLGIFPGLAIMLTVLSFFLIGDVLRDKLDPALARMLRK